MSRKPFEVRDLHDHGLWDEVTRTIRPIGRKPAIVAGKATSRNPSKPSSHLPQRQMTAIVQAGQEPKSLHAIVKRVESKTASPPLAAFDRRTAQKLGRGLVEPEARMDLHGDNLEMARVRLLQFLLGQRRSGVRLVLVITGKGASPFGRHTLHGMTHFNSPEREGRLRREVPRWLHEEPFREHVVGYQPAHPRHGGGGAFYLRLRKASGP